MLQFYRNQKGATRIGILMGVVAVVCLLLAVVLAADPPIHSDKPNIISFPAQDAKFVRFLIHAADGGTQPCIDELEVYGPGSERNLALASKGGKASASSCLEGYPQHTIEHLNDGEYGNDHSWIPAGTGDEWAQIELPQVMKVAKVIFSRDRLQQYGDRVPIDCEILLSLDEKEWKSVKRVRSTAVSGAAGGGLGGVAPIIPSPPPPPVVGKNGAVIAARTSADVRVAHQDELGFANLALNPKSKAAASSLLAEGQWPIHQISHLNDGLSGNSHSWISKEEPSWAEVDLGDAYWVYKVAFGSDASGQYNDRSAASFSLLTADNYNQDSKAPTWKVVYKQEDGSSVHVRTEFKFKPVRARWVRIAIDAAESGPVRIDEIEVFGQKDAIPMAKIGPLSETTSTASRLDTQELLRNAFLGEEHAWLKTHGRADLDPSLVPYNGRVKEYPRHVEDDRLPLPPLSSSPKLDGNLDDPCWAEASQGVVRVAFPYDFEKGPLVNCAVKAGWRGGDLFLALQTDRLLSSHVAVVSSSDWQGCGVVAYTNDGLVFSTYTRDGQGQPKLEKATPIEGAFNKDFTCCEMRLSLDLFPNCKEQGLRIGLGMGGRHTSPAGRPVNFVFASLALAQAAPAPGRMFQVRLSVPPVATSVTLSGNAPGLEDKLTLAPGESKVVSIPAKSGAIGPEYDLKVDETPIVENDSASEFRNLKSEMRSYTLHLFRYDPLERTLTLMSDLVDRLAAKRLNVGTEREELTKLRERRERLLATATPNLAAERETFFEARMAKRRLFFREPELAPMSRILFVKRHAFHPSHIYTDYTDAPFRPGGAVCLLDVPRRDGRFETEEAKVTRLFDSKSGIARDPVATYDLSKIYFGYRPSDSGYYHIMSINPDGSGLKQITNGPFHDFYLCPLPDGGVALISTRCTARVFCFRGGSSVLFRMDPDGQNMRPLSFASLSEWAPSIMSDGRVLWTRWEYLDKGADFSQTLWSIRPDGTDPELVFGNTIIQPNGYACGREVPGTKEICCTLVSHFGDINGPIALLDISKGRLNPKAITSITPEVPWPGMWPSTECFRDPVPLARDYFLCAHAPRDRFGLYVMDRFGNREQIYLDPTISSMAPTLFRKTTPPPALPNLVNPKEERGRFVVTDVYKGLEPTVPRGTVKYLRVVEEVRHNTAANPNFDHADFMKWYATPVDVVSGPYGWPTYVAKAPLGIVPVEADGSAHFYAPAGKTLYFQALDKDFNEMQRMRSVVQLQPGETRTCVGCHEGRHTAPPIASGGDAARGARNLVVAALRRPASELQPPPWGAGPFSFEKVVQPVLDAKCVSCHNPQGQSRLDFTATLDMNRVPASYRTLIARGFVHYVDCGWNSGGCEKREPLTFGTVKSKLWKILDAGHYGVRLTAEEMLRIKTWTDLNCPLWPDYIERSQRAGKLPLSITRR